MSILFCPSGGRKKKVPKNIIKRFLWTTFGVLFLVQFYLSSLQWNHIQLYPEVRKELAVNAPQVTLKRNHSSHVTNKTLDFLDDKSNGEAKWAYAFLVAGCDISSPLSYRNYFYNILVASSLLQKQNSSSDILVMIQLTKTSNATQLPKADLKWLEMPLSSSVNGKSKLRIHYLPPPLRDNFYNSQLEKFRILEFSKYDRILYMDADIMPLCSLDYLFELSESGTMQPNVVMAWFGEPASGGFFLLSPETGDYRQLQEIIKKREEHIEWNYTLGWGRQMEEEWTGIPMYPKPALHSKLWKFHGDFADQGLLYYWTRFHKQNVSIVYLDKVENWQDGRLVQTYNSVDIMGQRTCLPKGMEKRGQYGQTLHPNFLGKIPHRDFVHFTGEQKPWEMKRKKFPKSINQVHSSTDYWYYNLGLIFKRFAKSHPGRKLPQLPLKWRRPRLGRYPTYRSMIRTIQKKKEREGRLQTKERDAEKK